MEFFISLQKVPTVTHQQKKVNFKNQTFYEDYDLKAARQLFMEKLSEFSPDKPIENKPIRLVTKWLFGTKNKKKHGTYKLTKPDTENSLKLFKDCMTKTGFWKDDALVCSEITEKFWSTKPGIYVEVKILE